MLGKALASALERNEDKQKLLHHAFFKKVKSGPLKHEHVEKFLGQWWAPLHYFPTFLARSIVAAPALEMKTAISQILDEEVGEGDPGRAHERVFVATMTRAGLSEQGIVNAEPFEETRKLVDGYEKASGEWLSALGFLYGTEVADLTMVSGVGYAVRKVYGPQELEWVDIHVRQEPGHVAEANNALGNGLSADEEKIVSRNAEELWRLWTNFFTRLERVLE